jgi:hypothetical protein
MATMTFSIPDEVQKAFDEAFEGANKDAIVTNLLRRAIKEKLRRNRPAGLVDRLNQIRARSRPVTDDEIRRAREELRK